MKKPLILWGGVDIDPSLYGQKPMSFTQTPDGVRDWEETKAYEKAKLDKTPIVGVCRGAQLLCVMHEGQLYQHTKPARQDHPIETYDGYLFHNVAAGHHQIMVPKGEDFEVLAWNPGLTKVWIEEDYIEEIPNLPEVIWWPKDNHLAIQFHPEWAHPDAPQVKWINQFMKEKGIDYAF